MNLGIIFIVCAIVLLIFYFGYSNEKKIDESNIAKIVNNYGKTNSRKFTSAELDIIKGSFSESYSEFYVDDITWNDLDMWMVYKRINYCLTDSGDQFLYHILRTPKQSETMLTGQEQTVKRLMSDEDERRTVIRSLYRIGRGLKTDINSAFDSYQEQNNLIDYLINLGYVLALAICFWNALAGIVILVIVAIVAIMTYFGRKRRLSPYIKSFEYVLKLMNGAELLIKSNLDGYDFSKELRNEVTQLGSIRNKSRIFMGSENGNPLSVIMDYIKMLTHIDLIKINSAIKNIVKLKCSVEYINSVIGQLDTCVSIAYYRKSLDVYCEPDFDCKLSYIDTTEIYHPLLDSPVKNSFCNKNSILITGSNASGKSTFLKTIATNVLLAQSINTVLANTYKAPLFRLYTSLRVKDSIVGGQSYYMAEINSIKRIMDASTATGNQVIAMVDEILKGTNTTERIAAGTSILKKMDEVGTYVFAATHDLELAQLLSETCDNYHFEEEMSHNDVSFTYLIHKGIARSRNAIKLLELMGYDSEILNLANNLAVRREKEGIWTL